MFTVFINFDELKDVRSILGAGVSGRWRRVKDESSVLSPVTMRTAGIKAISATFL